MSDAAGHENVTNHVKRHHQQKDVRGRFEQGEA